MATRFVPLGVDRSVWRKEKSQRLISWRMCSLLVSHTGDDIYCIWDTICFPTTSQNYWKQHFHHLWNNIDESGCHSHFIYYLVIVEIKSRGSVSLDLSLKFSAFITIPFEWSKSPPRVNSTFLTVWLQGTNLKDSMHFAKANFGINIKMIHVFDGDTNFMVCCIKG